MRSKILTNITQPRKLYNINEITQLPTVVQTDQLCQKLYEANPVLLGYDVVQYHFIAPYKEGGVAVRGKPTFSYNFMGYQFWFSSRNNRQLFINDPWRYAPACGGFCSWGVARETQSWWPWSVDHLGPPASPWEGWLIVDGVLIFNIWESYSDKFMAFDGGKVNMRLAAARWKTWFGALEAGPFNTHCIGHGPLKNWCMEEGQPNPWRTALPECTVVVEIDGEKLELTEEEYFELLESYENESTEHSTATTTAITIKTKKKTTTKATGEQITTSTKVPASDLYGTTPGGSLATTETLSYADKDPSKTGDGDNLSVGDQLPDKNEGDLFVPKHNSTQQEVMTTVISDALSLPMNETTDESLTNLFVTTERPLTSTFKPATNFPSFDHPRRPNITVTVVGGGIVSDKVKFEEFANSSSSFSPKQRMLITVCGAIGGVVFVAIVLSVSFRKHLRRVILSIRHRESKLDEMEEN